MGSLWNVEKHIKHTYLALIAAYFRESDLPNSF